MAALYRLTVRMDGWPGAPGYMTFYCKTPTPFRSSVIAFIDTIKGSMPSLVSFTVPNEIDVLEDTTGELTGIETEGTVYSTAGAASGGFASPTGACVTWITNAFVNGRRVKGRTFVVPLAVGAYDNDGTLLGTVVTAFRNAAVTLFTSCDLAVWHRPTVDRTTTPPTKNADGAGEEVTGSTVADRAAVLKSRRA